MPSKEQRARDKARGIVITSVSMHIADKEIILAAAKAEQRSFSNMIIILAKRGLKVNLPK
jgi:3-deoxy-D-manno-octulosonic-acid transferase